MRRDSTQRPERALRPQRAAREPRAARPISPELMDRVRHITADGSYGTHIEQQHMGGRIEHTQEEREHLDRGVVLVLTVVTWLEIAAFIHIPWVAALFSRTSTPGAGIWPYVVAAGCFLPLLWRQRRPGSAFIVASAFTILYMAMPWPPAIVLLGPWLALFTFGSRYGGSRATPLAIGVVGISLGISALSLSRSLSVLQAVGMFALLAVAGAMGHGVRTRTQLFNEIRRTHDEADKRRADEERLRIAREVHDIMAHSLTLMTVQADAGAASFEKQPERAREALTIIGDTGRSTLKDLRSMLDVLTSGDDVSPREPVADLTCAAQLVESVRETGLDATMDTTGDVNSVPTVAAVAAYRIIQESLTNAVRHSRAGSVRVTLAVEADRLEIEVLDDGDAAAGGFEAGRGLRGMQERVTALSGLFEAGPAPRGGFRVWARIPFPRSA